jgi:hypothetical protein
LVAQFDDFSGKFGNFYLFFDLSLAIFIYFLTYQDFLGFLELLRMFLNKYFFFP